MPSMRILAQAGLKSRKENPQKLTQLSSRSHPRHLVGKRTAQKDTIIDITSYRIDKVFMAELKKGHIFAIQGPTEKKKYVYAYILY